MSKYTLDIQNLNTHGITKDYINIVLLTLKVLKRGPLYIIKHDLPKSNLSSVCAQDTTHLGSLSDWLEDLRDYLLYVA